MHIFKIPNQDSHTSDNRDLRNQPDLSFKKFSGYTRLTATGRSNRRGVWMLTIGEHLGKIFLYVPHALSQAGVDVFLFSPGIEAVLNLKIIRTSVEAAG